MTRSYPRLSLVSLLAAGMLAGACAFPGTGFRRSASAEEQQAYAEAMALLPKSRRAAAAKFEKFIENWPDSALADDSLLQLAEIAHARGDQEAALERLYFIIEEHPRSDSAPSARVRIARLERERGNAEAARHSLARARPTRQACVGK